MTTGFATKEGTARYRKRALEAGIPASGFRRLGSLDLESSILGFGCYRVDISSWAHVEALTDALKSGCNLIDTSTNYTDGDSERCVGEVITRLAADETVKRDEVIIVSKAGYLQGANLEMAKTREKDGKPFPEVVKYMDECWHCLHPEFLQDQITRSLDRLSMDRIDVLLLHNPEYFLMDLEKRNSDLSLNDRQTEFYRRIRAAFAHLETEVKAGRIGCYGVSSNTVGAELGDPEMTSASRFWEAAVASGGKDHHFKALQLPMNLFERGAAKTANCGEKEAATALSFAKKHNLAVLVNRPLNAFRKGELVRLSDFAVPKPDKSLDQAIAETLELENLFQNAVASHIQTAEGSLSPSEFFRWASQISQADLEKMPIEHWRQAADQVIRPQVNYLCSQLDRFFASGATKEWESWRRAYVASLDMLIHCVDFKVAEQAQKRSDAISKVINPALPETMGGLSLSQKSLAAVANTSGVTVVLNGMRKAEYVVDALAVLRVPPFEMKLTELVL